MKKRLWSLLAFLPLPLASCNISFVHENSKTDDQSTLTSRVDTQDSQNGHKEDSQGQGTVVNPPEGLWDASQDALRTGQKTLDFYNLNDFHGATEFNDEKNINEPGIRKLSTYLKEKKASNEEGFVLTSSGDMWQGSADSNITRGHLVTDWMNLLDFSAMALGNHEFDWKIDAINDNQDRAEFPFLSCNIIDDQTNEPVSWVDPYTTITRNGVHIGIIGAIGEGITSTILADNVRGLTFEDPTKYVVQWSNYLRLNGADVILYLLHDTIKNISLEEGNAPDAIFGGHTHQGENNKDFTQTSFKTPAIQAWCNGKDVGHISLTYDFESKDVIDEKTQAEILDTRSFTLKDLNDDKETDTLYQTYLDNEISKVKDRVILEDGPGFSKEKIPNIYNQYAYKYFKDNIDKTDEYDILTVQTNNARAPIPEGDVTYGMIYKALPFDNALCLTKITGLNIKNHLSNYGTFYLPAEKQAANGETLKTKVDNDTDYYVLMIDYIALKVDYSPYLTVVETYGEDSALPRNIVATYLPGYPNNIYQ